MKSLARVLFLLYIGLLSAAWSRAETPVAMKAVGDWKVEVTLPAGGQPRSAVLDVTPPKPVVVVNERIVLPPFNPKAGGWRRGAPLAQLKAQECTGCGLLDPTSLKVCAATPDATAFESGKDYQADLAWGTVGRLPKGRIGERQAVHVSYRYTPLRIDAVVLTAAGQIALRQGAPHVAVPQPPAIAAGETHLGNVWLPGRVEALSADSLFPILERAYPEKPKPTPTVAEHLLPKTMRKLRQGEPLRILAWGDSVTVGSFVPDPDRNRWQAQFVARLRERFPQAKIELATEAWGGRNTSSYLAEPPGSEHNYQEKVLGAKPDLVVSEFVNDAGLKPPQVEERYSKLLADFQKLGAEWIILTPHYTRPDWMGFASERQIDADPRPYVAGLREFAPRHNVALADASLRWGRLWRQGVPYRTLLLNAINHPDARGMKLFADSLMELFP